MNRRRSMPAATRRFELRVHLALLSIIGLLLLVNGVTNYTLYRARQSEVRAALGRFNGAALAVTRMLREQFPEPISAEQRRELCRDYQLDDITVIGSAPESDSLPARLSWFTKEVRRLPTRHWIRLAPVLLNSPFGLVVRGNGDEFHLAQQLPVPGGGSRVVVMTARLPALALIEQLREVIVVVSLISLGLVAFFSLALVRFVVTPIRRILEGARRAGREIPAARDEADAAVTEYERTIAELRRHQAELLRLHEQLQERADSLEQFNRYLLSSVDAAVVTLDRGGQVRTLNDYARRRFWPETGGDPGDYRRLFGSLPDVAAMVERSLRDGVSHPFREIEASEGEQARVFGCTVSALRDAGGQLVGVGVMLSDLTELYDLRRRLEQSRRLAALGEMAAGLVHQVRNSLGAIAGFARLVLRRTNEERICSPVESLLAEAESAEEMLNRFLTFARPLRPQTERVALDRLVAEVVTAYRSRTDDCLVELASRPETSPAVNVDPLLFRQALGNLLDNAIQACRPGDGRVTVCLEHDENGRTVRIAVTDNGRGIPADEVDRLFTPFYSTRPSGTGLGLPVAARIVEAFGGSIRVESAEGEGTTVTVTLPTAVTDPVETGRPV